jgi:hypothetical protein
VLFELVADVVTAGGLPLALSAVPVGAAAAASADAR